MLEYAADSPISKSVQDRFQRWPFAKRIARVISQRSDTESIVIGINGAWGEGKSTVFNFIEEELNTHTSVITLRFNPWRFPDESRLIRDFFYSLAAAIDKKLDKKHEQFGSVLNKFFAAPAAMAGAGEFVKAVGDMLSSVELEELKTRVESALLLSGKRVVVLMDDIDRLDKNEIRTVFRLVKLVADFHNTAYVLAFDAQMVAAALQEQYGSHDLEAGQDFLEKIIQVPLNLPQIPKLALREFCLIIVDTVLRDAEINLSEGDLRNFVRAFDLGLLPRLLTPRMARRYGNTLSFALSILKGEVNDVDLILIEGLRSFYPKLYDCVRDNRDIFLGSGSSWQGYDIRDQKIRKVVESATAELTVIESKAAIEVLKYLFPMIDGAFGGVHYADGSADRWAAERRLTSNMYFQRYFSYAVPEGQISEKEFNEFIAFLSSRSKQTNASELKRLCGSKNAADLILKLRLSVASLELESAISLAYAVVADAGIYPDFDQSWLSNDPFYQAAMLVAELLEKVSMLVDCDRGLSLARDLINTADPLRFAGQIVNSLSFEDASPPIQEPISREANRRRRFPEAAKQELISIFANRIKAILTGEPISPAIPLKDLIYYLSTWKRSDPNARTREYVDDLVRTDGKTAIAFIDAFRPTAWDISTGIARREGFDRREYDRLASFADPETFRRELEKQFGKFEFSPQFPRDYETTDSEQKLAEQFLWLHAYVRNEINVAKPESE